MKATFNVLDRGWIPVVDPEGAHRLLGIRETLAQAHLLREISAASPPEEYSLYRFLGVFLMDALRPKKKSSIERLLDAGSFDMAQIDAYIGQCRAEGVSFDLFDEERPFLQCPKEDCADDAEKAVSVLDCTLPSGNNHTHFTHVRPSGIPADAAIRKMLVTYWFCTAQAQGYPSGVYGAPPYFGVIGADNLFEMLVNLLIPMDSIGLRFDDPPVLWRRKTPVLPKGTVGETSWLQGMLFPTRRIRLIPAPDETVRSVIFSQGENYLNKEAWRDPYATYRSNENSVFPLRPHADAPIWRNICDLIDIPGEHASQMLRLYRELHPDVPEIRYTLYGVETSQASYLSEQRRDLVLPLGLCSEAQIDLLRRCVYAANQLSSALRKALVSVSGIPESVSLAAGQSFEKHCEHSFLRLCGMAVRAKEDMPSLYAGYLSDICDAVIAAHSEALSELHLRGHVLAQTQSNRKMIFAEIYKLKKEANV